MRELLFFQESLSTAIGQLVILLDEQDRLRVLDWEDHAARMHRLLRLQYNGSRVTVTDRGSRSAVWHSLKAYFAGELRAIDGIPVEMGGTGFQRSVWMALRKIPVGETLSYGALASRLKCPKSARAVGLANGANPVGIVVPCHRVIGSDGSLTGYGGGLQRKRWLLNHEGAELTDRRQFVGWATAPASRGQNRFGAVAHADRHSPAILPTLRSSVSAPNNLIEHAVTVEAKLRELRARLLEIRDLGWAAAVLSWDQATYMPAAGAPGRARQLALLGRLEHERMTDPALGRLLDVLAPYANEHDNDNARLIAVARRDFDKAIKVPASYVERANALGSASYSAWRQARPSNDFASMRPYLEKSLELTREYVEFFAPYQHMADPLIDDVDEGLTSAAIRALFDELRRELVPLVTAIANQAPADDRCLHGTFAERAQLEFGLKVATDFGYDLKHGRLDTSPHPFCTKFSDADIRITTRTYANDLSQGLFSTLHETGHALYEQGIAPELAGTPLGRGTSMAVHESQSRLWENVVGRSRNFWQHYYPKLQQEFPEQLEHTSRESFYRAINKVERSLIRTDADEVTYNLHIILRFDLELELLEGKLAVKDLPEAWRERYERDLAITPPDDRDGCLQDVHWYSGGIGGAFHSYAIGNILAAQFYAAALRAHPDLPDEIGAGKFTTLRQWLTENLYRHGRRFKPAEIVARATGEPMTIKPYMAYLRSKYGELYRL